MHRLPPARPHRFIPLILLTYSILTSPTSHAAPAPDTPFAQESHTPYAITNSTAAANVRAILVDPTDSVWIATAAGVLKLVNYHWTPAANIEPGPAYNLFQDHLHTIWAGTWNGLYKITTQQTTKVTAINDPITCIGPTHNGLLATGPNGSWLLKENIWQPYDLPCSKDVRNIQYLPASGTWIATGNALLHTTPTSSQLIHQPENIVSSDVHALAFDSTGQLWIGSLGGLDVYQHNQRTRTITASNGLPAHTVQCLAFDPTGQLWIGTATGLARLSPTSQWSFLHSQRWLVNDDVRDIAFSSNGTAWIATANGVSTIHQQPMTLAEKADYYHQICRTRHVRPPGLVEKCRFPNPNDSSRWEPVDDDNDGQYTAMYLAMESFRYAATGNPQAQTMAHEAFEALEFLQTVTDTPHFVARTVIPSNWTTMADPNETITPQEAADRRARDPRYKPVETRWRKSKDNRWLWKGDTSSDEITGHFYGYFVYFLLAADPPHKSRVQNLVSRIMDGLIDHNYVLQDIDGLPTRWGVWSPEKLNHDADWRVERPINSFEILSFLHTAHYITDNPRYRTEFNRLIAEHGYAENAARPKAYGLSERTHIDDELLALAAPGLLLTPHANRHLHARLMLGYSWAYETVAHDQNPFFNYTYAWLGGANFRPEDSLAFLRDTPLDLRQYSIDNTHRNDLTLVRHPLPDPLQLNRMLPPSERGVMRWDKNPWETTSGDFGDPQGHLESSGVFWLLPYWMARYNNLIQTPAEPPGHEHPPTSYPFITKGL
ncbi:MAG: hypothetical protein RI897_954 [Verrucomicrobiota bacterium]